jgi:hypothetical protein
MDSLGQGPQGNGVCIAKILGLQKAWAYGHRTLVPQKQDL